MQILAAYEEAFGQLTNKAKSVMYMHHSASLKVINLVQEVTSTHKQTTPLCLSIGDTIVLITHVLQGIPIHLLSAVNLPSLVIKKLQRICAQFFWSNSI